MSLRKSPKMTAARLEANRRNAQKSTGPRTARGKAQSRLNALRTGLRSRFGEDLFYALMTGRLGAVDWTAASVLTPEMAAHPVFAETLEMFRQLEGAEDPLHAAFRDLECRAERRSARAECHSALRQLKHRSFLRGERRRKKTLRAKPECY